MKKRKWKTVRVGVTLAQQASELARETKRYRWEVMEEIGKQIERKRRKKPQLEGFKFKI